MSVYLSQAYQALQTFAENKIFTTPERKRAGYIAAALTTSIISGLYLIPPSRGESLACFGGATLRSFSVVMQQLPDSWQFYNATEALRCVPEMTVSCALRTAGVFLKIPLGGFSIAITGVFMKKAGLMDCLYAEQEQEQKQKID